MLKARWLGRMEPGPSPEGLLQTYVLQVQGLLQPTAALQRRATPTPQAQGAYDGLEAAKRARGWWSWGKVCLLQRLNPFHGPALALGIQFVNNKHTWSVCVCVGAVRGAEGGKGP